MYEPFSTAVTVTNVAWVVFMVTVAPYALWWLVKDAHGRIVHGEWRWDARKHASVRRGTSTPVKSGS